MKQAFQKIFFILVLYSITAFIIVSFITEKKIYNSHFDSLRLIVLILFCPILFKYIVHLFVSPWYGILRKFTYKKNPSYMPKVSVIIPARNEEVGITSTITSVLANRYKNIEVIVINDGSTDNTDVKLSNFLKSYQEEGLQNHIPIFYKKIKNSGKAKALNVGVELSTGDIVISIDADSVMDSLAIESFIHHFENSNVMSVAGNVKIGNRSKAIGTIQQLEYMYGFYFKKADSLLNSVYIVWGAAAAYRRSIFGKLGGFDESIITEDIEFSMRIQNAGYKIKYEAGAVVYTEGASDITGLCEQRLRWKYGRLLTFYKYRNLFFSLKKKHSKFLTFIVLPIHLFAEMLLLFELLLLAIFYGYTFYSHDFLPLIFLMVLLMVIISFQIITDVKFRENRNLFILAPVAWCTFYFIDFIEYQALIRSFLLLIKKEKLGWQKWHRSGIL